MDHCAAVVVTYFPSKNNIRNILSLKHRCGLLVIVDNTTTDHDKLLAPTYSGHLVIIRNQKNIGLAAALNKGIKFAGQSGYTNIFLLDQDTILPDGFFIEMSAFRAKHEVAYDKKVLIVPNYIDRNSGTFAQFPFLTPLSIDISCCNDMMILKKNQSLISITSGTHLTYSTYRLLGPLMDDYFIDFVDHEYCLRAASKGIKVLPNCDTLIRHSIGNRSTHSFFGLTIKPTHHSALRKYYFARNSTRTACNYFFDFPMYTLLVVAHIVHEIISSIFYETKGISKIKAIAYGIIHGLLKKLGECKSIF